MRSERAKAAYRRRSETAEFPNAGLKERFGVRKFRVRGLLKARAELLWAMLTYNEAQWVRLVWRGRGGGLERAERGKKGRGNGAQGVHRRGATGSHGSPTVLEPHGSQPDSISPRRRMESDNRRRGELFHSPSRLRFLRMGRGRPQSEDCGTEGRFRRSGCRERLRTLKTPRLVRWSG